VLGSAAFVPFMQLSAADRRAIIEELLDIIDIHPLYLSKITIYILEMEVPLIATTKSIL
jgi:hypothetical protein